MPNRQPSFQTLEKDPTWRLGLLIAPAGSGKTRFLRGWAEWRVQEGGTTVAWLSLQPSHNQPQHFWADLWASFSAAGIMTHPISESSPTAGNPLDFEAGIIELTNALAACPRPSILILDRYQEINNDSIHQAVRLLIDSLPAGAQILIAAHTEPPLQQARLRVRRQLLELGPADLGEGAKKGI
jgi:LuxR family maltose regulon positive regulatory protein